MGFCQVLNLGVEHLILYIDIHIKLMYIIYEVRETMMTAKEARKKTSEVKTAKAVARTEEMLKINERTRQYCYSRLSAKIAERANNGEDSLSFNITCPLSNEETFYFLEYDSTNDIYRQSKEVYSWKVMKEILRANGYDFHRVNSDYPFSWSHPKGNSKVIANPIPHKRMGCCVTITW